MIDLTSMAARNIIPRISPWGWFMKGSISEYKPGRWRVRIWWKGERWEFYRNKRNEILEGRMQAEKAWAQINLEIEGKVFDPSEWSKDRPFLLKHAFETFQRAKQCGQEWRVYRGSMFENHIKVALGEMDIREVRAVHVNELHGKLIEKGLEPKTIKNILGLLKSVFKLHNIPNPGFPSVTVDAKEIKWLNVEQQEKIMSFLESEDQPIFRFMQVTGCRSGEACSLQRDDVNWNLKTVVIRRSMGHRRRVIPYTKDKRIKVIPISTFGQYESILKPSEVTSFIFSRDGRPYHKQRLQRAWMKANLASGLPLINVKNAFRHSLASQLINSGVPIGAISKMLGHSSIETTERFYASLSPETAWSYRGTVKEFKKYNGSVK